MEQLTSNSHIIQSKFVNDKNGKINRKCPYFDFPDLTDLPQAQDSVIAKTPNNGTDRDCDK